MGHRRPLAVFVALGLSSALLWSGGPALALRARATPFPIPQGSMPTEITVGGDGSLWFTMQNGFRVGRVTTDGVVTMFSAGRDTIPFAIATGPDGNVWFSQGTNGQIARITPDGRIREVTFSVFDAAGGITAGPDGNIWFTDVTGNRIWRLELPSLGLTSFDIPTPSSFPGAITVGSDGNLWFVEGAAGKIGRITPDGMITEPVTNLSNPFQLALAADGNLWFTEPFISRYGNVTPDGQVTFFDADLHISAIAPGPDDNLIFAAFSESQIGTIALDGTVDAALPPIGRNALADLTLGPDGAIWFLDQATNAVFRAVLR